MIKYTLILFIVPVNAIAGGRAAFLFIVPAPTGPVVNIESYSTGRRWTDGSYARSCNEYRNPSGGYTYSGVTGTGVYTINPDGAGAIAVFDVYCQMGTDGLTLVMRGKGGNKTGWTTTRDLNLGNSTAIGNTFKSSDAKINAIPKTYYYLVSDGSSFNGVSAYFSGTCTFTHTAQNNVPACTKSYSNAGLSTVLRNQTTYLDTYNLGISDAQGGPV